MIKCRLTPENPNNNHDAYQNNIKVANADRTADAIYKTFQYN